MRIAYFTHSLRSCWNHGNAHFLRGVLRELASLGHDVQAFEPDGAWSLANLRADHGEAGTSVFRAYYPDLDSTIFPPDADLEALVDGADLVIVHEWNEPALVAAIGRLRAHGARFTLLFHDTHHRAVSDPDAIRVFDLGAYDGVLAFGETLAAVYRSAGWGSRVFVWHEAADLRLFHPPAIETSREGLVWIGNWGDGERSEELERFLFRPARAAALALDIYGVRYPDEARETLHRNRVALSAAGLPIPDVPDEYRPASRVTDACSAAPLCAGRCPAFRPSGYSRHLPAAFPWSARRGEDSEQSVHGPARTYLHGTRRVRK